MASSDSNAIEIPDGFKLHTENSSHILLDANTAFLNPVQEFNRDLSVACIKVWSEGCNDAKEARWKQKQLKPGEKRVSHKRFKEHITHLDADPESTVRGVVPSENTPTEYVPYKFTILEALSATGLRSIRYAREIPLVKYVIANDLSPGAVEAMKRNVKVNGLGDVAEESMETEQQSLKIVPGKIRINEGDACTLMYNHREEKSRVDVIDLDPYGTAAPFIDAAVQCVKDGGLLCVTCTDLSVLATNNYPEKCFSNYGGVSLRAEYCHEAALRLVLHAISISAARYGRYITPLLSLSIDFYVRVFVRIDASPLEVKKTLAKTSMIHVCSSCQSFYNQPLGRMLEKRHEASGNVNLLFKTHASVVPDRCGECESALHVAGPMWSGSLHDAVFVDSVLKHLEASTDQYGTAARMKGMLTVAKEELDTLFYFTPGKISSFFHCSTPSLDEVASALLNAGHNVSRSHACAGSLKTNASIRDVHDIFRSWIKTNPIKLENMSESSPSRRLISKEPRFIANFTKHPQSITPSGKVKLIRYQENPSSHWGPGKKASSKGVKRKSADDH